MSTRKPKIVASRFADVSSSEIFPKNASISRSLTCGKTLVCILRASRSVFAFDLATHQSKALTPSHLDNDALPTCMSLFPHGQKLLVGYTDGSVVLWENLWNDSAKSHHIHDRHKEGITAVAFGPNGDKFYSGDAEGLLTCCCFSMKTGKFVPEEHTVFRYSAAVSSICIDTVEGIPYGAVTAGYSLYGLNLNDEDLKKQSFGPASIDFRVTPMAMMLKLWNSPVILAADSECVYLFKAETKLQCVGRFWILRPGEYIKEIVKLKEKVVMVISKTNIIKFVNFAGCIADYDVQVREFDPDYVIDRENSPMIRAIVGQAVGYNVYGDKAVIVMPKSIVFLEFWSWKDVICKQIEDEAWITVFQSLSDAWKFALKDCLGMEKPCVFLREVRKLGEQATRKYLTVIFSLMGSEFISAMHSIIQFAVDLGIVIPFGTMLVAAFKEANSMVSLCDLLAGCQDRFGQLFTPEFVSEMLDARDEKSAEAIESLLSSISYSQSFVKEVTMVMYRKEAFSVFFKVVATSLQEYEIAAVVAMNHGYLRQFIDWLFANGNDEAKSRITVWLLYGEGSYAHLKCLMEKGVPTPQFVVLVQKMLNLCPMHISLDMVVERKHVIDSVCRNIDPTAPYESIGDIAKIVSLMLLAHEIEMTGLYVHLALRWVFESVEPLSLRWKLISEINSKYPKLIKGNDLAAFLENAGFIDQFHEKYLRDRKYYQMIRACLMSPEHELLVVSYIAQFVNKASSVPDGLLEVKNAVLKAIRPLLLRDATTTVQCLRSFFGDDNVMSIHNEALKNLDSLGKYLYLDALFSIAEQLRREGSPVEDVSCFDDDLFGLICKFNPSKAIEFFDKHVPSGSDQDWKIGKMIELCRKYRADACAVHIANYTGNEGLAEKYIVRLLFDLCEADEKTIAISYEAQLGSIPALRSVLDAIDVFLLMNALSTKKKIRTIIRIFELPLHYSKQKGKVVQKTIILIFAHYLVQFMKSGDVLLVFKALISEVKSYSVSEYRILFKEFIDVLEYKMRCEQIFNSMLMIEMKNVFEEVFLSLERGILADGRGICGSCGQSLGSGLNDVIVFPCGHTFHDTGECCKAVERGGVVSCPLCATDSTMILKPETKKQPELAKKRLKFLMRRFEFCLHNDYTDEADRHIPTESFFAGACHAQDDIAFPPPPEPTKEIEVFTLL